MCVDCSQWILDPIDMVFKNCISISLYSKGYLKYRHELSVNSLSFFLLSLYLSFLSLPSLYPVIHHHWHSALNWGMSTLRQKHTFSVWLCYILTFDPAKHAIPKWSAGRKWHTPMASNRKRSRGRIWLMKWDKVKIPWYTHTLMHRKRVTSELHDSYFRLMTIKHAIPKTE